MPEPILPHSKQHLVEIWEIHITDDPTGPHYLLPGKAGCMRHPGTPDCQLVRELRYPVTCDTCEGPLVIPTSPGLRGHYKLCPLCKRSMCDHTLAQRGDGVCMMCPEEKPAAPITDKRDVPPAVMAEIDALAAQTPVTLIPVGDCGTCGGATTIIVCDACGERACWEGNLFCEEFREAGTKEVPCPECGTSG